MTDGVNELIDNANNASGFGTVNISDYSAYGYLGDARFMYGLASSTSDPVNSYAKANTVLNNRLLAACTNAKNAGIHVYTVMFNHAGYLSQDQQTTAQNLLKTCASDQNSAFLATDANSLILAFSNIALNATRGTLRLIK